MLLSIGTKVQIRHTGEEGVVRQFLEDNMIEVYLFNDGFAIPVSVNDLVQPGNPKPKEITKEEEEADRVPLPEAQFKMISHSGFFLAFDPNEEDTSYEVHLLNDTVHKTLFSFRRIRNGSVVTSGHGTLESRETKKIGDLLKSYLGDQTSYELDCWPVSDKGSGKKFSKLIRLRPKAFFKNQRTAPILNLRMFVYPVFSNFETKEKSEKLEDLQTYTKKHLRSDQVDKATYYFRQFDQHDVQEFAEFNPEIDLHIGALRPDATALPKNSILKIQLDHYEEFLAKAIRLGVERVFVIHGIGKGKLRNAIITRLMNNPDIQSFKNEYHPKYGWGATEIILK